ncbi:MAG: chlorophyll synthase ChlG [Hyphomicrobiales bacterium]|nr:chlorophyll synthase ChlG [Hyphomicrobiales bacterium]
MANAATISWPRSSAVLELLKPITWFPPMWAFGCGVVSSGASPLENWAVFAGGVLLAGPMVCGASQAVNDWFDRHVDAINEPNRPIPSGRIPGQWGLFIAIAWSALSLLLGAALGPWALLATAFGLALAWAYSAPPFRLKQNGWLGNAACGLCYEGLPWITAVAVMTAAAPDWRIAVVALLYSVGAHGIMTLNDFKSIGGDTAMGVRSLPVRLGPRNAAWVACFMMAWPQAIVIEMLAAWGAWTNALVVAGLLLAQIALMRRFLAAPLERAVWFSGFGVLLYVLGMLVAAFALRGLTAGAGA